MSDLAPFVAAVLRDRTVQELLDEINRLRDEKNRMGDMLMFRVTGRNGTPVYYEKMVTNPIIHPDDEGIWRVGLDDFTDITVPWETFSNDLEFRLGDVVMDKIPIRIEDFSLEHFRPFGLTLGDCGTLEPWPVKNPVLYMDLQLKPGRCRICNADVERVFPLNKGELVRMLNSGDFELSITSVLFSPEAMLELIHSAAMKFRDDLHNDPANRFRDDLHNDSDSSNDSDSDSD